MHDFSYSIAAETILDHDRAVYDDLSCRRQNSDIPWAVLVRAHRREAGQGWAALGANRSVGLGNEGVSHMPRHRENMA